MTTVVLVSMPWDSIHFPSLQVGTLRAILERRGVPTEARSYNLAFLEHVHAAGEAALGFSLRDYLEVVEEHHSLGLGDWIFAVPPFQPSDPRRDERYHAFVRARGLPERTWRKAVALRALVPSFLDRCVADLRAAAPLVVGFTTTLSQNVASLVLAQRLKLAAPAIHTVFGGANCDGPMGEALHRTFPFIDVVVRGEGERVLPELVADLRDGGPLRPQPGLCFRRGGDVVAVAPSRETVPMDEVPPPNLDEYFERLERSPLGAEISPDVVVLFESARGCWWGQVSHCTFCGLNGKAMTFRSKRPQRVLEELRALSARYRRLRFQAVDNIIDLHYLKELLPRLKTLDFDLDLFYETKANLKKEQVRLLREAGIRFIQPGIESLSAPILQLMKKGVTPLQNLRLLKWCAQYQIRVGWNLIYGFPGEPTEEYDRMAALIPSLVHLPPPGPARPLQLDRFSPYQERPRELGLEIVGPAPYYPFLYPCDDATLLELAYQFEYRHTDGRDPAAYASGVVRAVDAWREAATHNVGALTFHRGPGFLLVEDRRTTIEGGRYTFDEVEALIYLACDRGATLAQIERVLAAHGHAGHDAAELRDFLDGLVAAKLMYAEDGRYLALAIPETPDARGSELAIPEPRHLQVVG